MGVLRIILMVLFCLVCLAITILILMQEGKSANLGSIGGMADSYWGKNKAKSFEGRMVRVTAVLMGLFIIIAVVLQIGKI